MKHRCLAVAALMIIAAACRAPGAPVADEAAIVVAGAAAVAVEDLLPRIPAGYTPRLAQEWLIPFANATEPIPDDVRARLLAVSGLPLAAPEAMQSRDPTLILLYLFRPREVRRDSVLVAGGWMGLTTGDGNGGWGEQYEYIVDCSSECRIVVLEGHGIWN